MNQHAFVLALAVLFAAGCDSVPASVHKADALAIVDPDVISSADAAGKPDTQAGADAADSAGAPDTATSTVDPGDATFIVRGGVRQIFVTHATPDQQLEARDGQDASMAVGTVDHLGSFLFRNLPPGKGYRIFTIGDVPPHHSGPVDVLDVATSLPPQSFYANQVIQPGNGYITTRDGTTLAYFATLPGPADQGPYPTIVNYSGYDPGRPGKAMVSGDQAYLCDVIPVLCNAPSDASALIAAVGGYATVSVNMRGTGCSGGAYDYFETMQLLDGYDVIETVAAQPWAQFHKVGMTGLSYPGITQLFVAKTQPPSLAAITPLSVIGNTTTTLVPGGILNNGFALSWINMVYDRAAPYGQGWEQARVDGGDTICKENQLLHDQRVNNVEQAKSSKYYDPKIIDPLNPTKFVDKILVPVFLAGAWQDEQTGPFFVTLLDKFTSAPVRRFTVYNGVHPDGFAPEVLVEWKAFLDIYVAHKTPDIGGVLSLLAPKLTNEIYGVEVGLPPNRWTAVKTYDEAKAKWESEPELRAIFENGSKLPLGAPIENFELPFTSWPPKETKAQRWYFQPDGSLSANLPTDATAASTFQLDPDAGNRGIMGNGPGLWSALPAYAWKAPDAGFAVAFTSAPLTQDIVMMGTGSVDVWIRTGAKDVTDADLEVNLTEVRPDGEERYVQSGWLRASFRKLTATSTELWPEPSLLGTDVAPLPVGQWEKVRIASAGFGHPFRKGSRIRIAIDTPGDSRADWRFDLLPFTHTVTYDIAHSSAYPSSVALPVLTGAAIPAEATLPPCPSLRGQQCRVFADTPNKPAAP